MCLWILSWVYLGLGVVEMLFMWLWSISTMKYFIPCHKVDDDTYVANLFCMEVFPFAWSRQANWRSQPFWTSSMR